MDKAEIMQDESQKAIHRFMHINHPTYFW